MCAGALYRQHRLSRPRNGDHAKGITMTFTAVRRYALIAIATFGLAACGINAVPTAEENAKAQWGNVETALQRRADVIPNLVTVVQAAAISEQNILQGVRSDERRVGKGCVSTCKSRWWPYQ